MGAFWYEMLFKFFFDLLMVSGYGLYTNILVEEPNVSSNLRFFIIYLFDLDDILGSGNTHNTMFTLHDFFFDSKVYTRFQYYYILYKYMTYYLLYEAVIFSFDKCMHGYITVLQLGGTYF